MLENNAYAQMKRPFMGCKVVAAINRGRLDFWTWERIFYGGFNGRRRNCVPEKLFGG